MRRTLLMVMSGLFLLSAVTCNAQILHKKKKKAAAGADESVQPDKILYDRALADIKHGRHESGRLNLQTLINTYPDSEYLAKAKLGIADSYFKEGGTANMTQAISGYKDFIVFFPFLPEAAYAQKQVAMAHYSQMEKPDRDRTQAKLAEEEFQTFLEKYPKDALAVNAEQRLREVQEVLAEGEYRIGYYYYVKGDKRAAAARLLAVTNRYPLYTRADHALWMLGNIFETSERKDIAAIYYGQIVRNYPMSGMARDAKSKLVAFNVPVPQPDPKAVAWMTADQNAPRPHESLVKKPMALFRNGPGKELQVARRTGTPNLQPEVDNTSATDVLKGGGTPQLGRSGSGTGIVATVTPGTAGGAETTTASPDGTSANPPAANDGSGPEATGTGTAPASNDAPAASTGTPGTGETAAAGDGATKADGAQSADPAKTDGTESAGSTTTDGTQSATSSNDGKESSSKKKKGLRKIVPW